MKSSGLDQVTPDLSSSGVTQSGTLRTVSPDDGMMSMPTQITIGLTDPRVLSALAIAMGK